MVIQHQIIKRLMKWFIHYNPGDIFLVVGCSFHTGISVDLREVAKARGARIIEIQEDAAHNVRKVLEELLNNN